MSSTSYEQVYTDTTGYAECVHVRFDSEVTTVRRLAEMFFQGNRSDIGKSAGRRQRVGSILKQVFEEQSRIYGKLAVELMPLRNFVRAEDCHLSQALFDYAKNPYEAL